jgi:hypothetical protein
MKTVLLIFNVLLATLFANGQYCTTREWNIHQSRVAKIDTTSLAGLKTDLNLWANGKEIWVGFLNGSPSQHEQIIAIAKAWEQFANITFKMVPAENAHVRILLANSRANYTYIGTNVLKVNKEKANMQLDWSLFEEDPQELKMVVLHQFGHVLGMTHEHNPPEGGVQWKAKTVYKTFSKFGWDMEDVQQNILNMYTHRITNGFFYDAQSIMHWSVPGNFTKNGYTFSWNAALSEGDQTWAASQYPFSKAPVNIRRPIGLTI